MVIQIINVTSVVVTNLTVMSFSVANLMYLYPIAAIINIIILLVYNKMLYGSYDLFRTTFVTSVSPTFYSTPARKVKRFKLVRSVLEKSANMPHTICLCIILFFTYLMFGIAIRQAEKWRDHFVLGRVIPAYGWVVAHLLRHRYLTIVVALALSLIHI